MNDILLGVLLVPVGILAYGSGLLLWPVRRWRHRDQLVRGRALWFVFLAQAAAYFAVACLSILVQLGHFYYWFIFLLQLNIIFTIAGLFAWVRDGRYESLLGAMAVAQQDHSSEPGLGVPLPIVTLRGLGH